MDGILTKGVTLYISDTAATTPGTTVKSHWNWTSKEEVTSMFSFPSPRGTREGVDVTNLSHSSFHSIPGLRQNGDRLSFELYVEGYDSTDNYTILKSLADDSVKGFGLQFPAADGTDDLIYFFEGIPDITVQGGGINEAIKATLDVFLQSDIEEGSSFS